MGDSDRAVHVYSKIVEINPADLVAVKMSKDAAASASMKQGGWETAQSYRDLIKNKEQAVSLEQQGRVVKDIGMIENQLGELYQQYEQQPENVELIRKIAMLNEQKYAITEVGEDLAEAVKWFAYCNELTKGSDPAIARRLSDLQLKQKDHDIKELEDWFAAGGDQHEEAPQYREHLAKLKTERAQSLIDESRRRVERNPTDLVLRYELGERLLEAGNFNDAIPELQQARRNPNVRLKAVSLLGRCFVAERHARHGGEPVRDRRRRDERDGQPQEGHPLRAGPPLRENEPAGEVHQVREGHRRGRLHLQGRGPAHRALLQRRRPVTR